MEHIKDSIKHASHNLKACNYISQKKDFCDWTITIAFYSAVHYIRHLMFPCNINGKECKTFDMLFRFSKLEAEGRHGFQQRYVRDNYDEISFAYSRLYEMSNNARYIYYEFERNEADLAKKYLKEIKEYVENK
ncbi:hypothetical protein [Proteiniphilum saccharofermentans]|uniref:hypothetical protein n=1 Tax=Proteiniphilum saccharofermentans TaxID=1642647 RepID=UPI0028A621BC|nr:hypothetical protein [Proteiniphilum saccharofermentans]